MSKPTNPRVWRNVNGITGYQPEEDFENKEWGSGTLHGTLWKSTKNFNDVLSYLNGFDTLLLLNGGNNTIKNIIEGLNENNVKDVRSLQQYLKSLGYEGLLDDGYAGMQTMSALTDYVNRELRGKQEVPSKTYDVYTDNNGKTELTPAIEPEPVKPLAPKIWNENTPITPNPNAGPTWNRKQIRNFGDVLNVTSNSIGAMNDVLNPYGLKFNDSDLGNLYAAVGNRGSRGGWDRARERAIANREYKLTKGRDNKYYLKFNSNRLNNNAGNSYGYDISNLITTSQPQTKSITTNQSQTKPVVTNQPQVETTTPNSNSFQLPNEELTRRLFKELGVLSSKNGSKLNYMTQKYQTGGAAPQGDPQEQIIQLVQAAMSGDQQASAQIQLIMQAAQQGDQQAGQIAEMIMQIMNLMQGGAPLSARNGAKLNYIKRLKGECPDGYEMTYFKAGGKVCRKCQKKIEKNCGGKNIKIHRTGGLMEDIKSEMFAKGGAMNRNKHTAFGEEKGANVVSTNHAGRWGGHRAFNANGTHQLNKHDKPNKFTAFGDESKKKPTNVGLVGHHATGKTGRMQNRQKAGTTYKGTAFGGEKQKRSHRGSKASSIGRIGSINSYPKGHGGKSGIGKI